MTRAGCASASRPRVVAALRRGAALAMRCGARGDAARAARAAAAERDRPLRRRPARRRSTRRTARSRRSIRSGPTARRRRAGSTCRRARPSTRPTRPSGTFPVGTRFWKEFTFNGRKVETRFLWRASAGRWIFATLCLERGAERCCTGTRRRSPRSRRGRAGAPPRHPRSERLPSLPRIDAAGTARIQRAAALDRSRPERDPRRAARAGDDRRWARWCDERLLSPARPELVAESAAHPREQPADALGARLLRGELRHVPQPRAAKSTLHRSVAEAQRSARDGDAVARRPARPRDDLAGARPARGRELHAERRRARRERDARPHALAPPLVADAAARHRRCATTRRSTRSRSGWRPISRSADRRRRPAIPTYPRKMVRPAPHRLANYLSIFKASVGSIRRTRRAGTMAASRDTPIISAR